MVMNRLPEYFMRRLCRKRCMLSVFSVIWRGGMLEITAAYPAGALLQTPENLIEAAEGEHDEAFNLYPLFGQIASDEGFKKIAATFKYVSEVEKMHEQRYLKLLENIRNGKIFERPEPVRWYCRKCGYVHVGTTPPEICPSCLHPKAYFELFPENY